MTVLTAPVSSRSRLDLVAIALLVGVALFVCLAVPTPFLWWSMAGSLLLLARRRRLCAILLPSFVVVGAAFNAWAVTITPHTLDAQLLRLDFGLSRVVFDWTNQRPALRALLGIVYNALGGWAALVLAFQRQYVLAGKRLLQAGVLGSLLYLLCPAVGPVWAQTPGAPRNCMPSMHLTWALLLFCYSPRWLRPFAAIFALLTALATLGLGEHYVLDLVAALPFTWLMLRCNNEALLKRLVHRLRRSRRQKKGRESLLSRPSALPADPD